MKHGTVAYKIHNYLQQNPGKTYREIESEAFSDYKYRSQINTACQGLVNEGYITQIKDSKGVPTNYPTHRQIINQSIQAYMGNAGPLDRYRSWDICFDFYRDRKAIRTSQDRADHAALHLAWYLASWGMIRGSSRLLGKNHYFLQNVVEFILEPRFDFLHSFDPTTQSSELLKETLFSPNGLKQGITKAFLTNDPLFRPSDTLVTKILLGTLGCTVAYDQYAQNAMSSIGLTRSFGNKSIKSLCKFYGDNHKGFLTSLQANEPEYPAFKLMDMFLFQHGLATQSKQS